VGLGRFELPTSPLSGVRSNQLSYRPALAAPPPAVTAHGQKPGGSCNPHSVLKGFRGQRLNMLRSYASHDHRVNVDQAKKACIRIPVPAVRDGPCRLDGHSHPTSLDAPLSRKECKYHHFSFRKEVIQPQVLLRLPCYAVTPIMNYTLDGCPLAVGSPTSGVTHFRGVTGGVYKARERIHRGVLIRDY
jgi:hypothetical protein